MRASVSSCAVDLNPPPEPNPRSDSVANSALNTSTFPSPQQVKGRVVENDQFSYETHPHHQLGGGFGWTGCRASLATVLKVSLVVGPRACSRAALWTPAPYRSTGHVCAGMTKCNSRTMRKPYDWRLDPRQGVVRTDQRWVTLWRFDKTKKFFEITCPSGPLGPRQSCGEFGAALSSGAPSRNHSCPLSAPWAPSARPPLRTCRCPQTARLRSPESFALKSKLKRS